jgi:hypothetical protein
MAGTYYKYAERSADAQVNWADVGKQLSDMLTETNRVRQEKKDALETAQNEALKYLTETPNGEHKGARESVLDYADKASNMMRIKYKMMLQGQTPPKDFVVYRQNVTDNTNLLFNANKAFQEGWGETKRREADGISSGLESNNWEEVEGLGNWNNIGYEFGPNGVVMVGKMIEQEVDGKKIKALDKREGSLRSADYMNQAILGRIDKYDYDSQIKDFVDNLGEDKRTIVALGELMKQGLITSVEDITSKTSLVGEDAENAFKFINAENERIKAIAGSNLDSARILYDSAKTAPNNLPYEITTDVDEAKKGEHFILKRVDPNTGGFTYDLTDAQKKDTEEFIRTQMRAQYDYSEDQKVIDQLGRRDKPEYVQKKQDEDEEAANAANMLGMLWYGDNNQVSSAIDYFKGMKNKDGSRMFEDIERDEDGVTLIFPDGSEERIGFTNADGVPRTQEDFIRSGGPLLAGQYDINKALDKGSYNKGAAFNKDSKGRSTTVKRFTFPVTALALESGVAAGNIKDQLPADFTTQDTGGTFGNEVIITAPNGKTITVQTKKKGTDAQDIAMDIEDFVVKNTPKKSGGTGGTTGGTVTGGQTR